MYLKKFIIVIPLVYLFILLFFDSAYTQTNEVIDIGNRRELFVDHFMIDELKNAELRLHHPRHEGVALEFDKPWEQKYSAYITVIHDEGIYRMYYRGMPESSKKGDYHAVTCYAVSKDGIHWTKPDLGIFEVNYTKKNNVILTEEPFTHNFSPFLDTKPGVPKKERFKAVAGTEKTGLYGYVSSDGIHWKKLKQEPIFTKGLFDSQNVAFWSESENCYICYFRTWTGDGYTGFRTVSRTTSPNLLNWTEPVQMTFGDTPMEQLYTNATTPYFRAPHIYLAMPKRFFPDKAALSEEVSKKLVDNPNYRVASSDAVLMSSRGGGKYVRTFMEAFIRPGETDKDWVARDNTPALGIVRGNDRELFLYRLSHYAQPTVHVSRYSLRLDGFISVSAPFKGGELITKPFMFSGKSLEINFASSAAGGVQIEIQDKSGKPISGFTIGDCPEFIGDKISHIVRWKNGTDVGKLVGKIIKLRYVMKDADLFSFRFK